MMRPADIAQLVLLSAIWGASFMLLRVLVPAIGPLPTAAARLVLGAREQYRGQRFLIWPPLAQ